MNILKEQIKLSVAYPGWRSAIKKLKSNKNKKIFLFGTPMVIWGIMQSQSKNNIFLKIFSRIMNILKY